MNKETYKDIFRKKLNETRRNFGDVDVWDTPGEAPVRNPKPVKPINPTTPVEPPRYTDPAKYPKLMQPVTTDPLKPKQV